MVPGNPGATNAGRVLGVRWGIVVGLLDVLKAYLPAVVLMAWLGLSAALLGGMCVVLGHMFSPFLGGHGGKGVAAAFGAILAVAPVVGLAAGAVFGGFVAVVHRVGRASVLTCLVLLVVGVAAGLGAPGTSSGLEPWTGWWLALLATVVISRHHRNIRAWLASAVGGSVHSRGDGVHVVHSLGDGPRPGRGGLPTVAVCRAAHRTRCLRHGPSPSSPVAGASFASPRRREPVLVDPAWVRPPPEPFVPTPR